MTTKSAYTEGEKILCFCGPLIYEAKCLKIRFNEESAAYEYMVHYQGWNKNWDEWVPESRILKYNDANLVKAKELQKNQRENKGRKGKSVKSIKPGKEVKPGDVKSDGSTNDPDSRPSTPNVDNKKLKEVRSKSKSVKEIQNATTDESQIETCENMSVTFVSSSVNGPLATATELSCPKVDEAEEIHLIPEKRPKRTIKISDLSFTKTPFISIPGNGCIKIPSSLERWLQDDYDQIMRLNRLVNLPATISVTELLGRYRKDRTDSFPDKAELISELTASMDKFFCCCLGSFLLFKWERPQYADILEKHSGVKISEIYGPNHFLRLLVKMSDVVSGITPTDEISCLIENAEDILDFLEKRESEFFSIRNYGIATPDYHRRAI